MSLKPETVFKNKVTKFLRGLEKTWFVVNDHRAMRGIPDITACVRGVFVGMELKKSYGDSMRTSPRARLQHYNLHKIAKAGGYGWLVYPENWKETMEVLTALSEGAYYDHVDIRTNTQTTLRDGVQKVVQPRGVRPKNRLPRGASGPKDPEF